MMCPLDYMGISQEYSLLHKGLDLGWNKNYGGYNVSVRSVSDGICVYNRFQSSGGYVIGIYHPQYNMTSEYGHLRKNSQRIHEDDKVTMGQVIATMGNSGEKKGKELPYHLHFGLQKGKGLRYGVLAQWVNPIKYLNLYDGQIANKETAKKIKHTKKVTAKDGLNVRTKPSIKGKIVYTAKYNSQVETFGIKNGWNIVDNINDYYCSNNYLI